MKTLLSCILLSLSICTTGCAHAGGVGIKAAVSDMQSLAIENVDLTAEEFWNTYRSKDVAERRLAEMYLIGVLDSTESTMWCGYNIALPHSILEQIHIGFKKAPDEMMAGRAADAISEIMSKVLPCEEQK